ncbi:MAG: glycosyltransferase family 2 protein [Candidatus Doudnabacteria bacterium]|nr:glycosyltransferase family 2 protein [Candidatus Doudnabacteria bacterium]
MADFKVSIILPAHNEADNIPIVSEELKKVLSAYHSYEIIFVDDGSKDTSREVLKNLAKNDSHIKFISFSRNFGHQNALRAGLDHATGDCVICMDADMQQPPTLLPEMISLWQQGYEIVYTLRDANEKVSFFKRFTSSFFYWLINTLSDIHLETGAADFRLMDKKVVAALRQYKEVAVFYRGIIATMGFKKIAVHYTAKPRLHGKTKYSLRKMLNLSISGITGFSTLPLHLSTMLGVVISGFAFLYAAYAVVVRLTGNSVEGWSSLLFGIFFLGGVQLLMIGILGEYIGKLFFEVKQRPNYIISEKNI